MELMSLVASQLIVKVFLKTGGRHTDTSDLSHAPLDGCAGGIRNPSYYDLIVSAP